MMKKKVFKLVNKVGISLFVLLVFANIQAFSQSPIIWANPGIEQIPTTYTNPNLDPDPIFIFCAEVGQDSVGELNITGGYATCTYTWGKYDEDDQSPTYQQFVTIQDWGTGFTDNITNIPNGFYQVVVNCGGTKTCARAHVFINQSIVEFDAIAAGCDTFSLTGGYIDEVNDITIYDPPASPFIVDSLTEITVCFSADHTYVSDLGFYLVAPDGVTTVELLPSVAGWNNSTTLDASQVLLCNSNEVNTNCNSGNDVDEFCFSTGAINSGLPSLTPGDPYMTACVCNMSTPLSGTFASAGPWSPLWLNGSFNAAEGGWAVQIYDCIGADVGFLSEVSITFKGQSDCGLTIIDYDSGPINSAINDNSCDPTTASIYVVPLKPTSSYVLHDSVTASWSCSPVTWDPLWGSQDFYTNPNPFINPEPTTTTTFTLTIQDHLYDTLGNEITGYTPCHPSASNTYITLPTDASILSFPSVICQTDPPVQLIPEYYGGVWEACGSGAASACISGGGFFFPAIANLGPNEICYEFGGVCPSDTSVIIDVVDAPMVINLIETCDPTNQFYTVQFQIIGGNQASYYICDTNGFCTPSAVGTINGGIFISDPIPSGTAYVFIVDDNFSCNPVTVSGYKNCGCTSWAGTMPTTPIEVCQYLPILSETNADTTYDGNDGFEYYLHTNQFGTFVGSDIIAHNTTGQFYFQPGNMVYGQWYYISGVVGNNIGGSVPASNLVDINDNCLSVAIGTPARWMELPIANAGLDQQICGETVQLMADTTQNYVGIGAWDASVAVNWAPTYDIPDPSVTISDFLTNANNNPINTNVVFTWTITNGPCTHSDNVTVTYKPTPTAFAGNDTTVCGLTVDLNAIYSLGGPTASYGNWSGLGNFGGGGVSSPNAYLTVYNFGQFTYIWRENNEECFDQDYVTIEFLQNPNVDANHDDTVCGNSYDLNAISTMGVGEWLGPSGSNFVNPATPGVSNSGVNMPNATVIQAYGTTSYTATYTWQEANDFCNSQDDVHITYAVSPTSWPGTNDEICGNVYEFSADVTGMTYDEATWGTDLLVATYDDAHNPEAEVSIPNTGSMPGAPISGSFGDTSHVAVPFVWQIEYMRCVDIDTVWIIFYQIPVADASYNFPTQEDTICGLEYDFNAIYTIGASTGQWVMSTGSGTANYLNGDNADPNAHVTVSQEGTKMFIWTERNFYKPSCLDRDTVYIHFVDYPLVDAGVDTFICGLDYQLNCTTGGGEEGQWMQNSGVSFPNGDYMNAFAEIHVGSSSGNPTYTLVWTESNWHCIGTDSVDITFMEVPDATIYWQWPDPQIPSMDWSDSTVCGLLDSLLLSAEPVTNPSATGYWTGLDVDFFPNPNDIDADVLAGSYGVHEIWWVIDNIEAGGDYLCRDSSDYPIVINFIEVPVANAGGHWNSLTDVNTDTSCGYSYILDAIRSVDTAYGYWSTDNGANINFRHDEDSVAYDTVDVNFLSYDNPTQPYYELVWNEDNQWYGQSYGCADKDTLEVTFAPVPEGIYTIFDRPFCLNGEDPLSEYARVRANDDFDDYKYIIDWDWGLDNGILDTAASGVTADSIGQGEFWITWPNSEAADEHYLTLITQNNFLCFSSTYVDTIVEPDAVYREEEIKESYCGGANGEIFLSPTNGEQVNNYVWLDTLFNGSVDDNQIELLPGIYTYSARAKSTLIPNPENYKCVDTFTVEIVDTGYVIADFEFVNEEDTDGIAPHMVGLSDVSYWEWTDPEDSTTITDYEVGDGFEWRFYYIKYDTNYADLLHPAEIFPDEDPYIFPNGEEIIEGSDPQVEFTKAGYYKYMYVVTSEFECTDTLVGGYIFTDAESMVESSNVFTPNGDGENDVFRFQTETLQFMEGYIFNRWGKQIFSWTWNESEDEPDPGWWDGKLDSGNEASPGVYFWAYKATGKDGHTYEDKGAVHLIRAK